MMLVVVFMQFLSESVQSHGADARLFRVARHRCPVDVCSRGRRTHAVDAERSVLRIIPDCADTVDASERRVVSLARS